MMCVNVIPVTAERQVVTEHVTNMRSATLPRSHSVADVWIDTIAVKPGQWMYLPQAPLVTPTLTAVRMIAESPHAEIARVNTVVIAMTVLKILGRHMKLGNVLCSFF
jgi:hypothetical protein